MGMRSRRRRRARRRGERRDRRRERRQGRRDARRGISPEERERRDAAKAKRKALKDEAKTEQRMDAAKDFDRAKLVDSAANRAFRSEADAFARSGMERQAMLGRALQEQQARQQQQGVLDLLMSQARGEGPSVAQQQLQAGLERGQSQAAALAASARGNPFLAARQAQQQQAALAAQTNQQAAELRAQEMLAARQQAGALSSGMRAGDQANQGFFGDREMAFRGLAANERGQGVNTLQGQRNLTHGFAAQAQQQQNIETDRRRQNIGTGIGAATTILGLGAALASDKRGKTDDKKGGTAIRSVLDSISARRFRYKGQDTERVGIMAQDLERTPHGAALVHDTPKGKVIDVPQATGAVLAGVADLNDRLRRLEAEARRKRSA